MDAAKFDQQRKQLERAAALVAQVDLAGMLKFMQPSEATAQSQAEIDPAIASEAREDRKRLLWLIHSAAGFNRSAVAVNPEAAQAAAFVGACETDGELPDLEHNILPDADRIAEAEIVDGHNRAAALGMFPVMALSRETATPFVACMTAEAIAAAQTGAEHGICHDTLILADGESELITSYRADGLGPLYAGGPIVRYETILQAAGSDEDGYKWRWATRGDALIGHERVKAELLAGKQPAEIRNY